MERMTRRFAKMAFRTTKSIAQWPKKRLKICFAELEPRMRTMIKTASTAKIQISAIMGRSLPPRVGAFDCGDLSWVDKFVPAKGEVFAAKSYQQFEKRRARLRMNAVKKNGVRRDYDARL